MAPAPPRAVPPTCLRGQSVCVGAQTGSSRISGLLRAPIPFSSLRPELPTPRVRDAVPPLVRVRPLLRDAADLPRLCLHSSFRREEREQEGRRSQGDLL